MSTFVTAEITRAQENVQYQERQLAKAKDNVTYYEKQLESANAKLAEANANTHLYKQRIRKWVDALRSGVYEQGKSKLHISNDGYCCLGVACDISGLGQWEQRTIGADPVYVIREPNGKKLEESSGVLLERVRDWYGLPLNNPYITDHLQASTANDDTNMSFAQIADAIEARYLSGETIADDESDDGDDD